MIIWVNTGAVGLPGLVCIFWELNVFKETQGQMVYWSGQCHQNKNTELFPKNCSGGPFSGSPPCFPGQRHPLAHALPPTVSSSGLAPSNLSCIWVRVIFSLFGLNPSVGVHCSWTKPSTFRFLTPNSVLPVPTCPYLSSLTWPCAHTMFQSCPPLSALRKCPGLCPRAFVALVPLLGAPLLPFLSCSSWTSTCFSDFSSTRNPSEKLPLINKVFLSQAHSILGWTKWSRHVRVGQSSQNGQFLMVQPNTHCTRFLGLLLTNHYKISSLKHKNGFSWCSRGQKC